MELVVASEESVMVHADERMLRLALQNLMRNAAEAISSEASERVVSVRTANDTDPSGSSALIEVRDTGTGIPAGSNAKDLHSLLHHKAKGSRRRAGAHAPHHHRTRWNTDCGKRS